MVRYQYRQLYRGILFQYTLVDLSGSSLITVEVSNMAFLYIFLTIIMIETSLHGGETLFLLGNIFSYVTQETR